MNMDMIKPFLKKAGLELNRVTRILFFLSGSAIGNPALLTVPGQMSGSIRGSKAGNFITKGITGILIFPGLVFLLLTSSFSRPDDHETDRIQPFQENPVYWQYRNKPVLLLGGSSNDNLFQDTSPYLDRELDRLVEHGGNYLRCTMSSRDPGNVYPFYHDAGTGMFDLNRWNDEYWRRFEYFLQETRNREIIVQVEIWASYDFYTRESHVRDGLTAWDRNPFNPGNNINYTEAQSGLYQIFRSNGYQIINPFFNTTLPLAYPFDFEIDLVVLGYQKKFVTKLLSISLNFDHVLYVIDNETNADPRWPLYWSQYIRKMAGEKGVNIEVTEMWDTFDPTDGNVEGARVQNPATHFFTRRASVSNTLYDTDNYSYLDISNHNFQEGETHYKTGLYIWNEVQKSGILRPVNNTKIYGADDIGWATHQEGAERFWRNIFAGAASARFHRPPHGLGHRDLAMSHIKSTRMLTSSIDIFSSYPANGLLEEREENEAYCLANNNGQYLLYFPAGGNVRLDLPEGRYEVRWLDIRSSEWKDPEEIRFPGNIETPNDGIWAVRIVKQ